MSEVCIHIPDELDKAIREFDWEETARKAIFDKAEKLRKIKEFSSGIRVSDKEAKEFTDKISEAVAKRYKGG